MIMTPEETSRRMVSELAVAYAKSLTEIDRLQALLVSVEDTRIAAVLATNVAQVTVSCCRDMDRERLKEMEGMQERYQIAESRLAKFQAYV